MAIRSDSNGVADGAAVCPQTPVVVPVILGTASNSVFGRSRELRQIPNNVLELISFEVFEDLTTALVDLNVVEVIFVSLQRRVFIGIRLCWSGSGCRLRSSATTFSFPGTCTNWMMPLPMIPILILSYIDCEFALFTSLVRLCNPCGR